MRIFLILLLPLAIFAKSYSLKTLLDSAYINNDMIKSKELDITSKTKELEASESNFWPTIDIGASISKTTPKPTTQPGEIHTAYGRVSFDIYDGGKKIAIKRAKFYEHKASIFEKEAFKKSVTLSIINSYFNALKLQAMLNALFTQERDLKTQVNRIKKFKSAGLATNDAVYRLQSALEANNYAIANTKLALQRALEKLSLESGLDVTGVTNSHLKSIKNINFIPNEKSHILEANANVINQNAKSLKSAYIPHISIQDDYSILRYKDKPISALSGAALPDHQNKVTLSVNMRLFDHATISQNSEALKYKKMELKAQRAYSIKEQRMEYKIAKENLQTIYKKLKSAKSELKSAKANLRTVLKQYINGLADNVTYLDALNSKTLAVAKYKETLYDLEVAKALLYYYAGRDPREFVVSYKN